MYGSMRNIYYYCKYLVTLIIRITWLPLSLLASMPRLRLVNSYERSERQLVHNLCGTKGAPGSPLVLAQYELRYS